MIMEGEGERGGAQ